LWREALKESDMTVSEREKEFYDRFWKDKEVPKVEEGKQITIPGVDSFEGKRVLVCSCGTGKDLVVLARAGAQVFGFDISEAAVHRAKATAKANGVSATVDRMDFNHLTYPKDFFDVAYGTDILHHVDCRLAGKGLYRCLKPGGIACFTENSDRNPVLRVIRRTLFGRPGGYQRASVFFFKRHGTHDEYPLTENELDTLRDIFSAIRILNEEFLCFGLLARHVWQNASFRRAMGSLDRFLAWVFPPIMKYSYVQSIWLQKPGVPGGAP
jgi:SAM-dependent methyltransferase